jgi:predicted outer membrane repeat protein
MQRTLAGLLLLAFCLSPTASRADRVVVDYDGVITPSYTRIQEGINAAADGDTVMVIASFGFPVSFRGYNNTDLDFGGRNITLWAVTGPNMIAIDCEGAQRAILLGSGTDSTTVIKGFTFKNGLATDGGGAIRCEGDSPTIRECVFRNNTAADGGAILFSGGATSVTDCDFFENTATGNGGAIHATGTELEVEACTFSGNSGDGGGGIALVDSDLTMRLCTLSNNEGSPGSAVRLTSSTATIEQCILAFGRGGSSVYGGSPETFHSCVFGNADGDDLPGTPHDNLYIDPLLCDAFGVAGGNVSLCSNSPCLPAANPWTLQIGSKGQGCGDCDSPAENRSWGGIKALFR